MPTRNPPHKQKPVTTSPPRPDPTHPGSERFADQARDGGPRYHGAGWQQAAADEGRGRVTGADSADTRTALEQADDEIDEPGARGAVFGRGGQGAVQRDQPDDPSGPSEVRDARHGSGPHGHR